MGYCALLRLFRAVNNHKDTKEEVMLKAASPFFFLMDLDYQMVDSENFL